MKNKRRNRISKTNMIRLSKKHTTIIFFFSTIQLSVLRTNCLAPQVVLALFHLFLGKCFCVDLSSLPVFASNSSSLHTFICFLNFLRDFPRKILELKVITFLWRIVYFTEKIDGLVKNFQKNYYLVFFFFSVLLVSNQTLCCRFCWLVQVINIDFICSVIAFVRGRNDLVLPKKKKNLCRLWPLLT